MTTLFEQFLKERTYIKNVSRKTLYFYRSSFKAYQKIMDSATLPIKQDLTNICHRNAGAGNETGDL